MCLLYFNILCIVCIKNVEQKNLVIKKINDFMLNYLDDYLTKNSLNIYVKILISKYLILITKLLYYLGGNLINI